MADYNPNNPFSDPQTPPSSQRRSFLGITSPLSRRSSATSQEEYTQESQASSNFLSRTLSKVSLNKSSSSKGSFGGNEEVYDQAPPAYSEPAHGGPAYTRDEKKATSDGFPASPQANYAPSQSAHAGPASGTGYTAEAADVSTPEDPYKFLAKFDTVFLIDDSGSMSHNNSWDEVHHVLNAILPISMKHDTDGIDIYFMNYKTNNPGDPSAGVAPSGFTNVKSPQQIEIIFDEQVYPNGQTPTEARIRDILTPYVDYYAKEKKRDSVKPMNLIVITDGAASDKPERAIIPIAEKLDKLNAPMTQVGIQFFQVGGDKNAAEALQKLDDELGYQNGKEVRDIVDTVSFDTVPGAPMPKLQGATILKTLLGSVDRRLDRKQQERPGQEDRGLFWRRKK
ncbi:hypothetical protein F4778DRAFT_196081 [Xylariomycetidae sp. FL2044]|nr:hypothetical protein F4778DRAFT_196081 [Xylariomycetidae sp. FL2044]